MRALVCCKDLRSACCILQPWKLISLVVPQHKSILARRLPFQVAQAHTVPGANQVETKNTCPNFNSNCTILWEKVWDLKMTSSLSPVTSHFSKKTRKSRSLTETHRTLHRPDVAGDQRKSGSRFWCFHSPPPKKNPCVSCQFLTWTHGCRATQIFENLSGVGSLGPKEQQLKLLKLLLMEEIRMGCIKPCK